MISNPKTDIQWKYPRLSELTLIFSFSFVISESEFLNNSYADQIIRQQSEAVLNVWNIPSLKDKRHPLFSLNSIASIMALPNSILGASETLIARFDLDEQLDSLAPVPRGGEKVEGEYYLIVDEMPEPLDGIKSIESKVIYPEITKITGVEGKVYVLAYLDEKGKVNKVQIVKGLGSAIDKAVLNAVKQSIFKPGKMKGKPVKVKLAIPINVKIKKLET